MGKIISLLVFLALVGCAAYFGAAYQPGPFYAALAKPAWTPPDWLFAPVWTVLYVMIAIAGWLVWRARSFGVALAIWFLALALNAAWSYLMFGQKRIDFAFIDIVLLLLAIVAFIVAARPIDRRASLLFVPYLLWVGYATALNFAILRLNG